MSNTAAQIAPLAVGKAASLGSNYAWTLGGNAVYSVLQWAMVLVLAKLCNAGVVGEFALALAITAPVITFAGLDLRTVQATDARRDYRFSEYFWLRLTMVAISLLTIGGIVAISGRYNRLGGVILVVGAAKALESLSDIVFGLLQQNERMDLIATSQIMRGSLQLAALGAGIAITGDLLWGVAGQATVNAAVLWAYDSTNARRVLRNSTPVNEPQLCVRRLQAGERMPRLRRVKKLAFMTLPLGAVGAIASLNMNIPRYFIERRLGSSELGIYSGMAYVMLAGGMIAGALLQAASARLAWAWAFERQKYVEILSKLAAIGAANGLAGVALAFLCGPAFLSFAYGPEYAREPAAFVWIMAAAGMGYVASALGTGLAASRRFDVQLPCYSLAAIVTTLGCVFLVPRQGLPGAARALFLGMSTWCAGFGVSLFRIVSSSEKR